MDDLTKFTILLHSFGIGYSLGWHEEDGSRVNPEDENLRCNFIFDKEGAFMHTAPIHAETEGK